MRLLIDNLDMAGARDYAGFLDAENRMKIVRVLNAPATAEVALVGCATRFVPPVAGARVRIVREDASVLFTGYVDGTPVQEFLGYGEQGSIVRYRLKMVGDEHALDRSPLPALLPSVGRDTRDKLITITDAASVGQVDCSGVENLGVQSVGDATTGLRWSEESARLANAARAAYVAEDGCVALRKIGARVLAIAEGDETFAPDALRVEQPRAICNDLTLIGEEEPQMYVKDYFIADGHTLRYAMSQQPFLRPSVTVVEDEFAARDALRWSVSDPMGAITTSAGKLQVNGGSGVDGQTTAALRERLELGGSISLEHGSIAITGGNGVIGGLYSGGLTRANCIAGFVVSQDSNGVHLAPLVSGVTKAAITVNPARRYVLQTRLYASEVYRLAQTYVSSSGSSGGGQSAADLRVVLEMREIDPADPTTLNVPATALFDGVVREVPAFADYALVSSQDLRCAISYMRVRQTMVAEVRSKRPDGTSATRLIGGLSEGAECTITKEPAVYFYSTHKPVSDEQVVVRYRATGRSVARVRDGQSVARQMRVGDDGVRGGVWRVAEPKARTSEDCAAAARALLNDSTQTAWKGEYTTWTDFLESDVRPGDCVKVDVPSRRLKFDAVARKVVLEVVDGENDRARVKVEFANDAAEPIGISLRSPQVMKLPEVVLRQIDDTRGGLPSLANAEVTAIGSTSVSVDAGMEIVSGGGIEVRREGDLGWGMFTDRNLVGRFAARSFTLPRNERGEEYYMRMYDGATPPNYSPYTTLLHVDVKYDSV